MSQFRAWFKLVLVVVVLMWYLVIYQIASLFQKKSIESGFRRRGRFCRQALRLLGIKYNHAGQSFSSGACLYVSNHRSLLDPLIQLGYIDAFIVSKAEVGSYPLIGKGAKETGIILVHRDSQSSRKAALGAIEEKLLAGYPVLIYPEGTTNGDDLTKEFRRGAIELASQHGIPIVPVMIEYPDPSYYWVDGSFMEYFIIKFSQPIKHQVWGQIGSPLEGTDKSNIAKNVRLQVDTMITDLRKKLKLRS